MGQQDTDEMPEDAVEEAVEIIASEAVEIELVPTRLTLSPTKLILNWRLEITNTGTKQILFPRLWSDLACASRPIPTCQDTGRPDMDRARLHKWASLASGEQHDAAGEWQISRDDALPIDGRIQPWVIPVARFRLIGAGVEPTFMNFAIGAPGTEDGDFPEALHFDDAMQIFPDLVAKQLL